MELKVRLLFSRTIVSNVTNPYQRSYWYSVKLDTEEAGPTRRPSTRLRMTVLRRHKRDKTRVGLKHKLRMNKEAQVCISVCSLRPGDLDDLIRT